MKLFRAADLYLLDYVAFWSHVLLFTPCSMKLIRKWYTLAHMRIYRIFTVKYGFFSGEGGGDTGKWTTKSDRKGQTIRIMNVLGEFFFFSLTVADGYFIVNSVPKPQNSHDLYFKPLFPIGFEGGIKTPLVGTYCLIIQPITKTMTLYWQG